MRTKTMIAIAATIALVGGVYAWLESERTHKDTAQVEPSHELSSQELVQAFIDDESKAKAMYTAGHGQVILVRGEVRAIESVTDQLTNIVLETGDQSTSVICEVVGNEVPLGIRAGNTIAIKGVCKDINKDELFGSTDILLQRCVVLP